MHSRISIVAACLSAAALCLPAAHADSVELTNGDMLHGKVVSLDESELRIVAEQSGPMTVPRDKVLTIQLGRRGPGPEPKPPMNAAPPIIHPPAPSIGPTLVDPAANPCTISAGEAIPAVRREIGPPSPPPLPAFTQPRIPPAGL